MKDKNAINKIVKEYDTERKAREDELAKRKVVMPPEKNTKGPAYNTRFFNLKRTTAGSGIKGSKLNPIEL